MPDAKVVWLRFERRNRLNEKKIHTSWCYVGLEARGEGVLAASELGGGSVRCFPRSIRVNFAHCCLYFDQIVGGIIDGDADSSTSASILYVLSALAS